MKPTDISKLYENLTPQELAKVSFEATCLGDQETASKINALVPRRDYQVIDVGFLQRHDAYTHVANKWTIDYWKVSANLAEVRAARVRFDTEELERLYYNWDQQLNALGVILKSLEEVHGLNLEVIPRFACVDVVQGLGIDAGQLEGDALEYYETFLTYCESHINGDGANSYFQEDNEVAVNRILQ